MDMHNEASEGFPSPREDEPATLRQDIVDELADHLHCALNRELTKNITPAEAVQNVKRRFGDPRAIARRLWFDAMKEKIMSQRLTLAMMATLVCASIGATAFAWVAIRESRAANAALLQKMTAIAAARPEAPAALARITETNLKVLDHLAAQWCQVKFHFVQERKGGPPAVGVRVRLTAAVRKNARGHGEIDVETRSDSNGNADCGLVHFGEYLLLVDSPIGASLATSPLAGLDGVFRIRPGNNYETEIVCPSSSLDNADVRFSFNWPADFREKEVWIALQVRTAGRTYDGSTWTYGGSDPILIVAPQGNVLSSAGLFSFNTRPGSQPAKPTSLYLAENETKQLFFNWGDVAESKLPRGWTNQRFVLTEIAVIARSSDATQREKLVSQVSPSQTKDVVWQKHRVLGYVALPGASRYYGGEGNPSFAPLSGRFWTLQSGFRSRFASNAGDQLPTSFESFQIFAPISGKENVWKIPLGDSLLTQVRDAFKQLN